MRISDWSSDVCSSDLLLIPKNLHSPREVYQCHARKITADFAGLPPVTKCTFEVQPRGGQLATTKQAHALELQSKDKRLHVVPAFPNLNKPIAGGDGIRELTRVEVRTKKPIESPYRRFRITQLLTQLHCSVISRGACPCHISKGGVQDIS